MAIASVDGNLPTHRVLVGNSLTPGVVHQNSNKERWKVIELKSDILHDVVTVKITDQRVFWGLDTFHHHLRKLQVGRWLGKMQGAKFVHRDSTVLCPSLDCCWNASSRMIQQQRKRFLHGENKAEDTNRNIETTIPWLLVYLLHTNLIKSSRKQTRHLRTKSFDLLMMLTKLACNVEEASKIVNTSFGTLSIGSDGTMNGDAEWQKNCEAIESRCVHILTELGSNGKRGGPGVQQKFGNTAPMAEVLWQWSLLVHRCQRASQNKQIFQTGQELLTSSLAFISNQLSKWSLDKDEPSTAVLVELQKKAGTCIQAC